MIPTTRSDGASASEQEALRALTAGLAAGDNAAWLRFHEMFGPALFRTLLCAARGDEDLAREAMQLTYLRVARHARPTAAMAQMGAWLRLLGRSALADARRRRTSFFGLLFRRAEDPSPWIESDGAADSDSADAGLHAVLDAALEALPTEERTLLERKYFEGWRVDALAADLGITPKAVESRLTRARHALRGEILKRT